MSQIRTIRCDIPGCPHYREERTFGDGWNGWGSLQGISFNGKDNPDLCPYHLEKVADFIDQLR